MLLVHYSQPSKLPQVSQVCSRIQERNWLRSQCNFLGLAVHPNPLPALRQTLESTLQTLSAIPDASVYRQATTAITQRKLGILDRADGNVSMVEKEIDQGQIEEVLKAAEDELSLAGKMIEWKA